VLLTVADTGTGILPEDLDKVMEPFFTTKAIGKGSGLGLSMVYGFAKQSNGAFRIESELGTGTTAELWLPRSPIARAKANNTTSTRKAPAATRSLKIMLVDDHPEVRTTTAAVLVDSGHEVVEAANGAEALKLLEEQHCDCDLLISDYAMPHLSGTEFLRKAREMCPDVPALIITGYAESDAIADHPEGVEVLLKPFTPTDLEAAMMRITSAPADRG
jgi:CheY-like chemotaxis protein